MLILSVIAGVGTQSFLLALKAEREMDENAASLKGTQRVFEELRQDATNIIPAQMGGHKPYDEQIDAERGTTIYQILTCLPEGYTHEESPGLTQAMLVEFSLEQVSESEMRLTYSKQPVGATGNLGDPLKGILAEHVMQFMITPNMEDDESKGGGPGQGDTKADGQDKVSIPKGLNVSLQFKDSGMDRPYTMYIPIQTRIDKTEKQSPDAASSRKNSAGTQGEPTQPNPFSAGLGQE